VEGRAASVCSLYSTGDDGRAVSVDREMAVAKVVCAPSGRHTTVVVNTPLIEAVAQVGMPLGQSCDGVVLCGFCRVRVVGGGELLSPMSAEEGKVLKALHADDDERLACCARVLGPVTITTPYW
jgi:nitrite reductase (NADH) large subunit